MDFFAWRRRYVLGVVVAALASQAHAVPIPFKNCGGPGDLLAITSANASVWPPPVAAPASATASFDPSGNLVNLRLSLIHGLAWTFDSGLLPSTTSGGFVSLPATFPVSVSSPSFPILAGPYSTMITLPGPVTITENANLGANILPPVTTTVSLKTNGTPGFPLVPSAGNAYAVHVEMVNSAGARIFCMDLTVPLQNVVPFVTIRSPSNVPTLSEAGLSILAVTLCAGGLLAAGLRRKRTSGPATSR